MSSSTHPIECVCEDCVDEMYINNQMQLMVLGGLSSARAGIHIMKHCLKTPKRDSALAGYMWMSELWHGNDSRFFENMRMRKLVLQQLINVLQEKCGLVDKPRRVGLDESIAIFLLIIGQGLTYPMVEERLQHSSETISNHFHMILKAVCRLGRYIVKPSESTFTQVHPHIIGNELYYPYFQNCVGAIDGTHIALHVPDEIKVPFMNRKGYTSTNVLGVVDFDMCFIYAKVGNEGSMYDAQVLSDAMQDMAHPFPFPPEGKYYLADAGYTLMKGFLTPYIKTRYHIPEFQANREFRSTNEMFNYRHSSLRSIFERSFGVLKKIWRVLNMMTQMHFEDQIKIIWACITLYNFIRKFDVDDLEILGAIEVDEQDTTQPLGCYRNFQSTYDAGNLEMKRLHNNIRDSIVE